jgi:hypothetical protein
MNLSPKEKIIYFSKKDNFITFQQIRLLPSDWSYPNNWGEGFHWFNMFKNTLIIFFIKDEIGCL